MNIQPGIIIQITNDITKRLQEEIDWDIMCSILTDIGWYKVETSKAYMPDEDSSMIKEWCDKNLRGTYKALGKTWIFEQEKDAMWFALKWS